MLRPARGPRKQNPALVSARGAALELMGSTRPDRYLSPFYVLFVGAQEVRLSFPVNPDPVNAECIGPPWDELGNLARTERDTWGSEVVAAVSLGEGRYRRVKRCELFSSDHEFALERGDGFSAMAVDAPMSAPQARKTASNDSS